MWIKNSLSAKSLSLILVPYSCIRPPAAAPRCGEQEWLGIGMPRCILSLLTGRGFAMALLGHPLEKITSCTGRIIGHTVAALHKNIGGGARVPSVFL